MEYFAPAWGVIRLDLRGHGDSDKPATTYTIPVLADDVRRLLDGLGVGQFIPIGHSMGGMIAQTLALTHPVRIERMILVDSISRMVFDRGRGLLMTCSKLLPFNLFVAINITHAFKPGYPRDELERYIEASQSTPRQVVMSCYRAMQDFDVLDRVSEIQTPTLLLHGYYDVQLPTSQALRMALEYPDALLKIIDAGHESPVENPAAVSKAIEYFLTARQPGEARRR